MNYGCLWRWRLWRLLILLCKKGNPSKKIKNSLGPEGNLAKLEIWQFIWMKESRVLSFHCCAANTWRGNVEGFYYLGDYRPRGKWQCFFFFFMWCWCWKERKILGIWPGLGDEMNTDSPPNWNPKDFLTYNYAMNCVCFTYFAYALQAASLFTSSKKKKYLISISKSIRYSTVHYYRPHS